MQYKITQRASVGLLGMRRGRPSKHGRISGGQGETSQV